MSKKAKSTIAVKSTPGACLRTRIFLLESIAVFVFNSAMSR